jgi:FAD/FMN-containing dehydrogenase
MGWSTTGVGLAQRDHLALTRSDAELDLMRDLKRVRDPAGTLGAGRVFTSRIAR